MKNDLTFEQSGLYYNGETLTDLVRFYRNHLLMISDWTQLEDAPLTQNKKLEWAAYRQELRDFMFSYDGSNPNPQFPIPPEP